MSHPPVCFSLVLHFHQPVGNFEHVFARAHELAYQPLLDHLEESPEIRAGLHFSGCLLDWLLPNVPGFRAQVERLVGRGQVEILAGAYYEPVLAMLRPEDARGQIAKHLRAMQDLWSVVPSGLWLAERVWEPNFPSWLEPLGIRYTLVDDNHLHRAGQRNLLGTWLTEDGGRPLRLLVNLKPLRRLIPWQPLDAVWENLAGLAHKGRQEGMIPLACLGDDAERFGLWPGTHEHCWVKGYMRRFFDGLKERSGWIRTVTPSEYMRLYGDQGRIYVPTASYLEMMDWALPSPEAAALGRYRREMEGRDESWFLSGGFWRNFLVKYPEVHWLQKRGMDLSKALEERRAAGREVPDKAWDAVWASQCNCAYWHGVFGGVYLSHLRQANAANLLAAQEIAGLWPSPHWSCRDTDVDGLEELHLRLGDWQLFLCPGLGGAAREMDCLSARRNWATTLSRRPEPYHQALIDAARKGEVITPEHQRWTELYHIHSDQVRAKEPGLERFLVYDRHPRLPFVHHLLPSSISLEDLTAEKYPVFGSSWDCPMDWSVHEGDAHLEARLEGEMRLAGEQGQALRVSKTFRLDDAGLEVTTVLRPAPGVLSRLNDAAWAAELALGLTSQCTGRSLQGSDYCEDMEKPWEMAGLSEARFSCPYSRDGLTVHVTPGARLCHVPLWAVTKSESGFERTPQGSALMFIWPLQLGANSEACFRMRLRFDEQGG